MKKKTCIPIKIGDKIKIISGYFKNESGEVSKIYYTTGRIIINGINYRIKHIKPSQNNKVGERKRIEAPIHHSNVKLIT
jgi:large subunit ribosomal protein L24